MTRTALVRAAVTPLIAAALGGAALGTAVPALLAPSAQAAPATAAPGQEDDVVGRDRPVRIDVGRFEPRTVTPGATVTVTGTLTNTGSEPIDHLSVRLQRGDVLTTRAELAAQSREPDPATTVVPPFQDVPGSLAPGDKRDFSYTVSSDELRLDRDGVYPVLLNVNGDARSDGGQPEQRRVGELATYVVQQPAVPAAQTAVAWLWPLAERTHRDATGEFVDDDLTASISDGGRLDRALAVVERIPEAGAVPSLLVTVAIDPSLVEELTVMAAGAYSVHGGGTGRGTAAAAAFLRRLTTVAAAHPVLALPYGDVDADSLQAAGLTGPVLRSLPGSPDGTAQQPPDSGGGDDAGVTAPPSDGGATVAPAPAGDGTAAGARILADALDVEPITDLALAPGGALRADTLHTLQTGGVDRVVLGTGGVSEGAAAVGLSGSTASARITVPTASGQIEGLVADDTLGAIVGSAEGAAGGPRMAEQRYLAELAALTLEAPAGATQTVLIAPPRALEAGPEGAGAMMADTAAALPWLRPSTVAELSAAPAVPGGDLVEPAAATGLDPAGMADVVSAVADRDDLAGAVVGDADTALSAYDAAISRTTSVAWRSDAKGFAAAAADLRSALDRLRSRVTLVAPADGTYTLGSSDAPLVLTVRNDLPIAVHVLLDIRARSTRGLSISDTGVQTLEPGQNTVLQVPTQVRQSGGFGVTAQLTTPGGQPLGDRIQLQVKSTAYGSISLLITIGAAALLGLLFLRRLVNFVLRRRRAARAAPAGPDAPEGAVVPLPPNRSPV